MASDLVFFTAYNRPKVKGVDCSTEPSMTKQSFKDECDINNIMARFERSGLLDFVNQNEARYGDATSLDYQDAMLVVANANSMFEEMPAKQRAFFKNDPAAFLAFMEDPANLEKSYELGLRVTRPPQGSGEGVSPTSAIPKVEKPAVEAPKAGSEAV